MNDRDVSIRALAAVAVLSLSTFAYVTTEALPIGLLTPIAESLQTTPAAAGLLVTGYGFVVVVLTVPLTRLARGVGRRRLLVGLLGVLVLGTLGSALAPTYALLFTSRALTAAAQALFWALVVPVGASLVPERLRGRAVTILFAGSSLAGVLGVPAGTWVGQQAGWRVAFVGMSAFALGLLVLVSVLLPSEQGAYDGARTGTRPDARRYRLLLATTALAVTGAYAAFTYVEPFLLQVSGLHSGEVSPVLLVRGLAGVAGVALASLLVDRNAWLTGLLAVGLEAAALLTQYLGGTQPFVAVTAVALSAGALAAFAAALGDPGAGGRAGLDRPRRSGFFDGLQRWHHRGRVVRQWTAELHWSSQRRTRRIRRHRPRPGGPAPRAAERRRAATGNSDPWHRP